MAPVRLQPGKETTMRRIIDPADFEPVTYPPHRPRKQRSAIAALRRKPDEEQRRDQEFHPVVESV